MRSDGLCFAGSLQHEKLGKYSDRLEEDGERPQDFRERKAVIEDTAQYETRSQQVFGAESVNGRVVSWPRKSMSATTSTA